jgi:diguanylate cyclase (GGDEF)-like protein
VTVPLRLLLVEDSEDDALLIVRELRKGGYAPEWARVDTAEGLEHALQSDAWDVVITDHNMPRFSSQAALGIVKQSSMDVPIIIVSGSIGEDIAVEAMKGGAHDYIMKDRLARLVPAIDRELREAKNRNAHRRAQEVIRHLAYHDALTGLVNRVEFENSVRHALRTAGEGARHGLLYLDLDQFKIINDTCGHVAGDELLRQLAMLLKEPIRESDTLARLGGDEFGVLLVHCSLEQAQAVAERMLQIIREFRFGWQDKTFAIGASAGLVMIDGTGQTLSDLLRAADMACYAAKERGRNRVQVYRPDDAELLQRHGEMQWISRLRRALEEDRFVLYSQPIVPLAPAAGHLRQAELMVRLRNDDGTLILPGAFIPAAERYSLMPELDRWVVRHAFAYVARRGGANGKDAFAKCFVNLSGATLSDDAFAGYVKEQLRVHAVPPRAICFEITETAAIANLSSALEFIGEVKQLGCEVALDDFGAGLSSFTYLKTLRADYLKIDGSFIRDMLEDPMDAAIVQAINSVGHVAGLKTIAEFVETDEIRVSLERIGVDYAQGYGIAPPSILMLEARAA